MAKQLMPRAEMEPRLSDVHLPDEQINNLSLFSQLKRKPSLDKYPGALVIRRYRKSEMIFRQGEGGWTAFYILTSEDVLNILQFQLQAATRDAEKRGLEAEIAQWRQRAEQLRTRSQDDELRTAAMVYLAVARKGSATAKPALARLLNFKGPAIGSGPVRNREQKTLFIPIDGPVTLNYDSLKAPLQEGELFGEMSCLYRTPRSGTVQAKRDCYMVEILRNILDQVQKDPAYKARTDEIYKKRVLDMQLRKLSLFSDLNDAEFAQVHNNVELLTFEPGDLICDENDRSDSFYIVRSGLVKVMRGVSALFHLDEVTNWQALCTQWREAGMGVEGEVPAETRAARARVWQMLPERVRGILAGAAAPTWLNGPDRDEVVFALNDLLKNIKFSDPAEFKPFREEPGFQALTREDLAARQELLKKKKDWEDGTKSRRVNRLLLDAILADTVRPLGRHLGLEVILTYCSRSDHFGEMGLMLNRPRSATCVAYGHPNEYGQVELVRVPGRVFWQLMRTSPGLRQKVQQQTAEHKKKTKETLLAPVWDDTRQVQTSPRFEELGLIQGQKLMLIDLERCTRCDECVKACVNTHGDGRSRLFLDGPRFGKYLVPTTCRSCLDPVCLIGCPVGSIHRGDNREILIEDWCIGCGLCADNCPYGSIQMHDLGIIPVKARGWRFLPAAAVPGDGWQKPGYRDAHWLLGESPFVYDRETREQLEQARPKKLVPNDDEGICFRYEFHLGKEMLRDKTEFKLEVVSLSSSVAVWVNGQQVTTDDKPRRGRHEYTLPQRLTVNGTQTEEVLKLHAGVNVLAVRVTPTTNNADTLMQARLDEVRRPDVPAGEVDEQAADEITEKLVTERAVVCDLCSSASGQVPACVNACPHDAALRVNARFDFPNR